MLPAIVSVAALLAAVAALSVKSVREDHRMIVIRLGRPIGVSGPGLVFVLPFVDLPVDVDLDQSLPGWRSLTQSELAEKLLAWYAESPNG
jgi:regulator of protease activity HflC (stomatin/prohibitin superfamily)